VTVFRSRRIEQLLGAQIGEVSYEQLRTLATNQVHEAADLEYKRDHYGSSDKAKQDLCTDVAALANSVGGVIVIGIEEDAQARAAALNPVTVTDVDRTRMTQVIAESVHPPVSLDMVAIEDADSPGVGAWILGVPASPARPHAVWINRMLRYPRRRETTIERLSESQVTDGYRQRLARVDAGDRRLVDMEQRLIGMFDPTAELAYVVTSLVPTVAGDFTIDTDSYRAFEREIKTTALGVLSSAASFTYARPGARTTLSRSGGNRRQCRGARQPMAGRRQQAGGALLQPQLAQRRNRKDTSHSAAGGTARCRHRRRRRERPGSRRSDLPHHEWLVSGVRLSRGTSGHARRCGPATVLEPSAPSAA
jgi:schlafen family protein